MFQQYPNTSSIGEKWATIVTQNEDGTHPTVISFIYGTTAVRSMIESSSAYRRLGMTQHLVATDASHCIGY